MNPHVHAAPGIQRAELVLSGLSCPACVRAVEEAVGALPGVEAASVNLAPAHAFVDYEPGRTSLVVIHDAIKKAGYLLNDGGVVDRGKQPHSPCTAAPRCSLPPTPAARVSASYFPIKVRASVRLLGSRACRWVLRGVFARPSAGA